MPEDLRIRRISAADAGEVFTLQRASFVQEALLYDTVRMPPLTETLPEVVDALQTGLGCVALLGTRMVGTVRARKIEDDVLEIGRLAVAPDLQGRGIGTQLLAAVEQQSDSAEAELYTGSRSAGNIRLYERAGYVETKRVALPGVELVYLRKRLR